MKKVKEVKDRQITQAITPIKALGIALLFLVLINPALAATNCTCTAELTQLTTDSASMRRQVDLQLRRLDELSARQWVTTGELENFSGFMNQSFIDTTAALKAQNDANTARLDMEIKTVKIEAIVLVLFAIVISYLSTSWIYGEKYFEIQRKLGVVPRRTPMTPREQNLESYVRELERRAQANQEEKAVEKAPGTLKDRIISIIGLLLVIAGVIGAIYLAGLYWKVW